MGLPASLPVLNHL